MIRFRKWSVILSVALMVSGCTAVPVFPYETITMHVPVEVTLDGQGRSYLAIETEEQATSSERPPSTTMSEAFDMAPTDQLPEQMRPHGAELPDPAYSTNGETQRIVQEYKKELTIYIQAVEDEDYAGALGPGRRALDLLGGQLSEAPDSARVPTRQLVTLAVQLSEIYSLEHRRAEGYLIFGRALDYFTAAWGTNSLMHYSPLRKFTAEAIWRKDVDQAEDLFASLSEVVRKNYDFASSERAGFFLVEGDMIVLRAKSSTSMTRQSKRILFSEAPKAWTRAYEDYEATDDKTGAGDASFHRGRFEMEVGHKSLAQDFLQKALDLYEEGDLLPGDERVLQCHTLLAHLHLQQGKQSNATPHLQHVERHQSDKEREQLAPLFRTPPKYPSFAKLSGVRGWVRMEFTVTAEGKVIDPVVLDSKPVGTFEQSAKDAVVKWKYTPMLEGGVPVASKMEVQLRFEPPKKK